MMQPPSYLKIASRQFWPILTGILLLMSGVLLVSGLVILQKELRFESGGVKTAGRVTEKYSERRGSGKSRRMHHLLRYEYAAEGGRTFTGEDSVKHETWQRFEAGQPVEVEYLRDAPATSRVAGESKKTDGQVLSGIGGGATLLTGFFFLRNWKRVRTTRRLWEEGRRVDGVVSEVRATNVSHNRVKQWRIAYTYNDYAGRQHTGQSDYLPPAEAMDWKPGDKCAVLCDKDQPEISVWAGRGEG